MRPNDKQRAKNHLSLDEREESSRSISVCLSINTITGKLNRHASKVYCEINLNIATINPYPAVPDKLSNEQTLLFNLRHKR
jgi:IS30 family transposase